MDGSTARYLTSTIGGGLHFQASPCFFDPPRNATPTGPCLVSAWDQVRHHSEPGVLACGIVDAQKVGNGFEHRESKAAGAPTLAKAQIQNVGISSVLKLLKKYMQANDSGKIGSSPDNPAERNLCHPYPVHVTCVRP